MQLLNILVMIRIFIILSTGLYFGIWTFTDFI